MQEYFHRQIQLWGEDTQKLLQTKTIAIVGAGGLGSSIAYALSGSGIGYIHILDFDAVSLHNIHRQITFKIGDDDKNKAYLNAKMIESRNPFVKVTSYDEDFKKWLDRGVEVDLIIDATDNLQTRADINRYSIDKNIPWVYGSVEAFHGQVCFFKNSSFEDAFKITSQTPQGIAAPMVMHIASLQANLALRYLAGLSVKTDQLYYIFFNNDGEMVTQKFALPKR